MDRFVFKMTQKHNRSSWRHSIPRFYAYIFRLMFSRCSLTYTASTQNYRTNIWFKSMFISNFLLSSVSSLLAVDSIFRLGCHHCNFFSDTCLFLFDIAFWSGRVCVGLVKWFPDLQVSLSVAHRLPVSSSEATMAYWQVRMDSAPASDTNKAIKNTLPGQAPGPNRSCQICVDTLQFLSLNIHLIIVQIRTIFPLPLNSGSWDHKSVPPAGIYLLLMETSKFWCSFGNSVCRELLSSFECSRKVRCISSIKKKKCPAEMEI